MIYIICGAGGVRQDKEKIIICKLEILRVLEEVKELRNSNVEFTKRNKTMKIILIILLLLKYGMMIK